MVDKKAEQPAVNMTMEELQQLMATVATTIVTEQARVAREIPPDKAAQIASRKAHWKQVLETTRQMEEAEMERCSHIRPEDGKSLFWFIEIVHPAGARALCCCRCRRKYQNFEGSRLVNNPDYERWIRVPSGIGQLF